MKKQFLLIISIFVVAVVLSGAVSATSSSISSNGKVISVKSNYVSSTLKDQVTVTKYNGAYGYGYYGVVKTTGHNIKGTNINRVAVYLNKYHNYFYYNDLKWINTKTSNSDGSWSNTYDKITSTYKMTETTKGRTFNGLTYSGSANYVLYYTNGQRLVKNATMVALFYQNGVKYAKFSSTLVPTYKFINHYYLDVKDTVTSNTLYSNLDTRKSIITTTYSRSSSGLLTRQKTTGISIGKEKINGKTVSYTGKISTTTVYDPKDTWHERFISGNYYEIKTSASSRLVKRLPIESL